MVQLTDKDADFVANLAREAIKMHTESYENIMQEGLSLLNEMNCTAVTESQKEMAAQMTKEYEDTKREVTEELNQAVSNLQRVIELMIGGSNE